MRSTVSANVGPMSTRSSSNKLVRHVVAALVKSDMFNFSIAKSVAPGLHARPGGIGAAVPSFWGVASQRSLLRTDSSGGSAPLGRTDRRVASAATGGADVYGEGEEVSPHELDTSADGGSSSTSSAKRGGGSGRGVSRAKQQQQSPLPPGSQDGNGKALKYQVDKAWLADSRAAGEARRLQTDYSQQAPRVLSRVRAGSNGGRPLLRTASAGPVSWPPVPPPSSAGGQPGGVSGNGTQQQQQWARPPPAAAPGASTTGNGALPNGAHSRSRSAAAPKQLYPSNSSSSSSSGGNGNGNGSGQSGVSSARPPPSAAADPPSTFSEAAASSSAGGGGSGEGGPAAAAAAAASPQSLLLTEPPPDVFIVSTPQQAAHALDVLAAARDTPYMRPAAGAGGGGAAGARRAAAASSASSSSSSSSRVPVRRYFAVDTEVAWLDLSREAPTGHGAVLCFSIYAGEDVSFGTHPTSGVRQTRLWVDIADAVVLDPAAAGPGDGSGDSGGGWPVMRDGRVLLHDPSDPGPGGAASAVLAMFRESFLCDPSYPKVWHNYGFDRHVLANMGVECAGFGGDTLQMARLLDASRRGKKNYGLESLSGDKDIMKILAEGLSPQERSELRERLRPKAPMKSLFGSRKLRSDGSEGKLLVMPSIQELHVAPGLRPSWIDYSALDAQATWQLREALERHLAAAPWCPDTMLVGHWRRGNWRAGPPVTAAAAAAAAGHEAAAAPVGSGKKAGASAAASAAAMGAATAATPHSIGTLWDFYCQFWLPFGRLLTDMEAAGMKVDRQHLRAGQAQAEADRAAAIATFTAWAASLVPDAAHMNVSSGAQIRQLLFPDSPGRIGGAGTAGSRRKAIQVSAEGSWEEEDDGGATTSSGGKASKSSSAAAATAAGPGCRVFKVPNPLYEAAVAAAASASAAAPGTKAPKKPKKHTDIVLHGVWGRGVPGRLKPEVLTATGAAAVSLKVLRALAGKPGAAKKELAALKARSSVAAVAAEEEEEVSILPDAIDEALAAAGGGGEGEDEGEEEGLVVVDDQGGIPPVAAPVSEAEAARLGKEAKDKGLGSMYVAMGGGLAGLEACVALEALCEVSAIDKLLSAFITPLQGDDIATGHDQRVHCSLNINTETGRLSARRPNLQNQPALEKDRYKVRRAFTADVSAGHTLLVADYGQLELRLLAHVTNCRSMLDAFEAGGDFHSRTALSMYDHIQKAVEAGEVALEGGEASSSDPSKPPVPLLKDKFGAERRKAKVLNFSIAYGKTAHGLAKDFGTSVEEAAATVERWYRDRWEVKAWQEATIKNAERSGEVRTLLGRTRPLRPDINSTDRRVKAHAERAAINTPIQGSAADVATAAMLAIDACPRLKALGWRLLMQVHDEVILEGPKASAGEAKALVVAHMTNPWAALMPPDVLHPLRVELSVDAKVADTWYEAK